MQIKTLIVEDEYPAQELLASYCKKIPYLQVVFVASDGTEAFNYLKDHSVDLILTDIEMPNMSGINLIKALGKNRPLIIITTAYTEYAVEGFDLAISDYLVKPFSYDRFSEAVHKLVPLFWAKEQNTLLRPYTFIPSAKKLIKIDFEEILFVQADNIYVNIYLTSGKCITCHETLKDFETRLPAHRFLRINRSAVVAVSHIRGIDGKRIDVKGVSPEWTILSPNYENWFYFVLGIT